MVFVDRCEACFHLPHIRPSMPSSRFLNSKLKIATARASYHILDLMNRRINPPQASSFYETAIHNSLVPFSQEIKSITQNHHADCHRVRRRRRFPQTNHASTSSNAPMASAVSISSATSIICPSLDTVFILDAEDAVHFVMCG